jgi:DNA-binding PadR family transcriptional regulator
MSLRHAVLGFLSVRPFTGYDLKKAFDHSVRHFWASDKAAIYRTLGELEGEGLTRSERVPGTTRPDRHVHHLTDAGAAELDRWLRTPIPPPLRREPFLLQLFFSERSPPEALDGLFAAELAAAEGDIAALRAVAASLLAGESEILPAGIVATLHAGLASHLAWRDWLVDARRRFAEGRGDELARELLAEVAAR